MRLRIDASSGAFCCGPFSLVLAVNRSLVANAGGVCALLNGFWRWPWREVVGEGVVTGWRDAVGYGGVVGAHAVALM